MNYYLIGYHYRNSEKTGTCIVQSTSLWLAVDTLESDNSGRLEIVSAYLIPDYEEPPQ